VKEREGELEEWNRSNKGSGGEREGEEERERRIDGGRMERGEERRREDWVKEMDCGRDFGMEKEGGRYRVFDK